MVMTIDKARTRYQVVTEEKAGGATYTPKVLSDFVAEKIVEAAGDELASREIRVLDPAIGHGELLLSLSEELMRKGVSPGEICGFETDIESLELARARLAQQLPNFRLNFQLLSFLQFVETQCGQDSTLSLFKAECPERYDLIIANPPYVRTQVMGAPQSQFLAKRYGLAGRVDLYFPFILGMARILKPAGVAGVIVSNRFMTTKAGASVRQAIREQFNIIHVWDLGDTRLFEAAVLPSILLLGGKTKVSPRSPGFTSIYETNEEAEGLVPNPIKALCKDGVIATGDGRRFRVQQGTLETSGTSDGVWRASTRKGDEWLSAVGRHSWGTFGDIGKIRVGVKTCADKVFIRSDWDEMPLREKPELLRPVVTHHIARRYRAISLQKPLQVLYPHECSEGKRQAVDLSHFPRARAYLERHQEILKNRGYLIEAGRNWYEIWVPQDPSAWEKPKLVFRDISARPVFWIDQGGAVVNGDCYWLVSTSSYGTDLLWLAVAVGNSSLIEQFYDLRYHNKLYAGRRRFMTQYVEQFPLPNPTNSVSQIIIRKAKELYEHIPAARTDEREDEVDRLVWKAFGLDREEIGR